MFARWYKCTTVHSREVDAERDEQEAKARREEKERQQGAVRAPPAFLLGAMAGVLTPGWFHWLVCTCPDTRSVASPVA